MRASGFGLVGFRVQGFRGVGFIGFRQGYRRLLEGAKWPGQIRV